MGRRDHSLAAARCGAMSVVIADQHPRQGAIQAVVMKFMNNVGGDKRSNAYFAGANLKYRHKLIVEQVCAASDDPCTYSGRDMKTTHKDMKVTTRDLRGLRGRPGECARHLQCSEAGKG